MGRHRYLVIVALALLISGCSLARKLDHSDEYKNSQMVHGGLALPADLEGKQLENYYPVPSIGNTSNPKAATIIPPGSNIDAAKSKNGNKPITK